MIVQLDQAAQASILQGRAASYTGCIELRCFRSRWLAGAFNGMTAPAASEIDRFQVYADCHIGI